MSLVRWRPGFRKYWLALARTRCWVRNRAAGNCVIAEFILEEGDGLILPHDYLRVDHDGDQGGHLIPMGSRAQLERRSREILATRKAVFAVEQGVAMRLLTPFPNGLTF